MSGWHEPQRAVRIIILFLLLFLLNPVLTKSKEVAPNHPHSHSAIIGKRNLEDSKIDIHLLYNAYRERVKEGNVETRYSPGLLHDNSAVAIAEEGEVDSMTKYGDGVRMKDLTDMRNELLEELKMVTPLPKKLDSNDHDNDKQNTLVKQETKEPETKLNEQIPKTDQAKNANPKIKSTVILKMDLPSTMNVESLNLRDQSNTARDAVERRVAELNRVFKEFIGLWRKPNGDPMHTLILGNENSDFASKPVHLNALNDLMNVVENLKQPDTVDNFVKAINDEMMRDTELVSFPNCLNFIDHLEENTPIQKEDKDLQYPGLKDSPATEFQDLVSPNKLAKQNDYQEKSDNKESSITKHNEQSSRISKRVAVEAKSPDAKADKTKSVVTKSAESKSAKVKSTDAKIADAKTTDAKTTDAKTTDPKVAEARSAEAKSSKAKSAKVKHTETEDSKVVKAKSVEAKVDKSKSTDAEAVESKSAASAETNTVNAKSGEVKSTDSKVADSKSADSKSADAKSAEAKTADAKITDSTSSDSAQVRSGGLYEEYKNKLREILTANDNQRKFLSKVENSGNEDRACHCDERRTLTLAVGADGATVSNSPLHCHCDASKHSNSIDGTSKLSNGRVACHCDSQTCSVLETVGIIHPKVVANKVLFAHKKKEDMEDEGPKPYFISNSKQRQMIWNDIPLSGEKKSFDNVNKNRGQMMYSQPSVAAPPVDLKPNMDHQRAPSQKNKSEVQSKKHTQLQYLVKVLQDKHRAPALRKAKKRNLINKYNRLAALVRRAKRRDLFGGLDMNKQFGSQPSFPQVFVNQPGQVQPTGANGGGRMLGMMAKQLNVSPVEMAQRIASSTGTEPVPVIENPLQYTSGK